MTSRLRPPRRLKRIQSVAVVLLLLAGGVNYLDRGSLSIANTSIRADLGFSGTRIGILLSVFSMAYGVAQLPAGALLDRFGARMLLGAGMLLWSLLQTATGLVNGFWPFVAARIGLATGEAPWVISSVKSVREWFAVPDRGLPLGIVNSATPLSQAIAPPVLTLLMLHFGWRGMFVCIGLPGIALSFVWYWLYRDRRNEELNREEIDYLESEAPQGAPAPPLTFAVWRSLFRLRTVWGMMLGFGGVNYTTWLYISWMPGYFEAERHVSVRTTGLIASIPFFCGALGMFLSGWIADRLIRRGVRPIVAHKILILVGMTGSAGCTLALVHAPGLPGAVAAVSMAIFFIYMAGISGWGLVQAMAPASIVASVAAIQNFGSFVCASFAPVVVGWLLDRTHSFHLALTICSVVTLMGALCYLLIVKDPIQPHRVLP